MKVRTIVLSVGLVSSLGIAGPAWAQVELGGFGVANVAHMTSDTRIEPLQATEGDFMKAKTFLGAGALVEYRLNEGLSLVAEPMYVRKGASIEGARTVSIGGRPVEGEASGEVSGPYLEVPLLLKLSFGSGGVRPYLVAGPSLGFRVGDLDARYTVRVSMDDQLLFEEAASGTGDAASVDFGLALGGGVSLPVGGSRVFVEAQYMLGLTDVDTTSEATSKHRGVQVRVGISFPVGG